MSMYPQNVYIYIYISIDEPNIHMYSMYALLRFVD